MLRYSYLLLVNLIIIWDMQAMTLSKNSVVKATYGIEKQKDVTDLIKNNIGKSISVNSAFFNGDPAPGFEKQLTIIYKDEAGKQKFAQFRDGSTVNLTATEQEKKIANTPSSSRGDKTVDHSLDQVLIDDIDNGKLSDVQQLFSGKVIPDINAEQGAPLNTAINYGRSDIVAFLIKQGVNVNEKNYLDDTPLTLTIMKKHTTAKWGRSVPPAAAMDLIVQQLIDAGADINQNGQYERSPLMWAFDNGDYGMAVMLIAAGADLSLKDHDNETARQIAEKYNKRLFSSIVKPLPTDLIDYDKAVAEGLAKRKQILAKIKK